MTPIPMPSVDLLAAGWDAVARAAWVEAREHFVGALDEVETPEALEGLGVAAWFLDDAPLVFDAREGAYRLYRERGDRQAAPRIAAFLAMDYGLLRGEDAVSQGWFQRAERLLEGMGPTPEHGFLALQAGIMAIDAMNDTVAARQAATQVIEIGRVLEITDLEMTGLALEGIAMVSDGEVEEGMRRLDEATAAAIGGEMQDPLMIGLTSCYMMFACERVRDLDRATQWCERVKEYCRRVGLRFLLSICRVHYASILITRGDWAGAEEELVPVVEEMVETMPGIAHDGIIRLADLRLRQGRLAEAEELLSRADFHAFGQLGLAAVALERGDYAAAADGAERFLRHVPKENVTERAAGIEILVRARVALNDVDKADAALVQLRSVSEKVGTPLLRAATSAAEGVVAVASEDYDQGRRLLEDAVDLYRREAAPYDEARARMELAGSLAALGREEEAVREAERALTHYRKVGAEFDTERAEGLVVNLRQAVSASAKPSATGPLTGREVEILRLVADGLFNREIADRLVLSQHTVKRHVANILTKLGVSSRAAAVAKASRDAIL